MNLDDKMFIATYDGKSSCGFKNGEEYPIWVTKDTYGYYIMSYSIEEDKIISMHLSSEVSFNHFWKNVVEIIE